ncbi:hypothetical protein [Brevibacterium sp. SMBL_HHYL_HB1]|uniref:hypothetical protein n=1 Tax=Brevibacterium sp. SMBL_HHYL_HB1 TaxID=2777556 RepID=UPI001BA9DE68|nr:hypothetical protein [Brevibacterium sp. SMBL_HHYL_HB1]QUL79896.1 hypothetical protein IG171_03345 [Brevibacterium sp. SMBL_HHYL_HB1]
MLVLIVFWVVLVAAIIGFIGAVAERGGQISWATLLLFVVAFAAAVVDRAPWL